VFTAFGTVVPSVSFGAMLSVLAAGIAARRRWLAIGGFALVAGLLSAATADGIVGALSGAFWPLAGVTGLIALGTAAAVHGLARRFGPAGIAVALLAFVLLAQASSGGAVTALMLPDFFATVSGWLPTGAGVTAVRNVVYFDGAAIAQPLLVLAGWALVGVALELATRWPARADAARDRGFTTAGRRSACPGAGAVMR
jgi:uncharacterized phage infection (PIP) family protein YhgE